MTRAGARCWTAAIAATVLYLVSAGWRVSSRSPESLFAQWRAYDDFAIAAGYAARGEFQVAPYRVRDFVRRDRDDRFRAFRSALQEQVAAAAIRPAEFWRVLPATGLSPDGQWRLSRQLDDVGRAFLLGVAFRALGGASPFLLFWLAIMATAPVLGWVCYEACRAGYTTAGVVFAAACAVSAFLLDSAVSGYSAAGFHVVGLLALLALAIYATLGRPSSLGLLARGAIAGLVLGVSAFSRGTVLTFVPALAVVVALGVRDVTRGQRRGRKLWLIAALASLLAVPYLLMAGHAQRLILATTSHYGRQEVPRYHDASLLIWKGLGDFDREKGYTFWDMAGQAAVRKASPSGGFDREGEIRLRHAILKDVIQDPIWFGEILLKRLVATVALTKLWSYGPRDGVSVTPATAPNEGAIDSYYSLTRQADWLAFGPHERELPTFVLLLPALGLAVLYLAGRRSAGAAVRWRRASGALLPGSCLALAVLPVPILITTATAFDPQCFVLVHFLCLAFLLDAASSRNAGATVTADLEPPGSPGDETIRP